MNMNMLPQEKEWFLASMTWPEAKEALTKADYVIIPVGSIEQHGPHICLGNDAFTTFEIVKKVVEGAYPRLRLVVLPPLYYGQSEHHMAFPGTVSLRFSTFMDLIYDICSSLKRHGVRRIAVINGHGGNTGPLNLVLQYRVKKELGIQTALINWWTYSADIGQPTHADRFETSVSMYLLPEFVREERIEKPSLKPYTISMKETGWNSELSPLLLNMDERTNTGALLPDPTLASKDLGKKFVETAVCRIIYVLEKLIALEPAQGT
ncbi:creatininase family protein [Candidatus Bathyarchaeota archaeon]|nr:creatininase family protein [Candidatus Bathyarchaeota archaeon]MBS7627877.1 creatininase family protein [Candidatus Bathyarchaeota archaeon]